MVNKKNPPAFPVYHEQGMTLRDYFAAAALQGFLANPELQGSNEVIVTGAYMAADLMLAERAKETP